jgi:hypothetical protein
VDVPVPGALGSSVGDDVTVLLRVHDLVSALRGAIVAVGPPGAYEIPPDFDADAAFELDARHYGRSATARSGRRWSGAPLRPGKKDADADRGA